MPDEERKSKLSGEQQFETCKMLALGYTPELVKQELKDEFNVEISRQAIRQHYQIGKKKFIQRLAFRMEKKVANHLAMQKITRVNILMKTLSEALTWRLDKIYFDKWGDEIARVNKRNIGVINKLIEQVRIEAEGHKPLMTANIQITINQLHELVNSNGQRKEENAEQSGLVTRASLTVVDELDN